MRPQQLLIKCQEFVFKILSIIMHLHFKTCYMFFILKIKMKLFNFYKSLFSRLLNEMFNFKVCHIFFQQNITHAWVAISLIDQECSS